MLPSLWASPVTVIKYLHINLLLFYYKKIKYIHFHFSQQLVTHLSFCCQQFLHLLWNKASELVWTLFSLSLSPRTGWSVQQRSRATGNVDRQRQSHPDALPPVVPLAPGSGSVGWLQVELRQLHVQRGIRGSTHHAVFGGTVFDSRFDIVASALYTRVSGEQRLPKKLKPQWVGGICFDLQFSFFFFLFFSSDFDSGSRSWVLLNHSNCTVFLSRTREV